MPDFRSTDDEAVLYVLGEMTAAERREFAARMAKSAELRQAVRELEEGMVVLSTGLPRRRPPSEIWLGIEKALGRQRQPGEAVWWRVFWRNGWAAAVLCLLGWSLHAIWLNAHKSAKTQATRPPSVHETIVANASSEARPAAYSLPPAATNTERQLLQLRAEEISDLRLRIAAMAQETNELSQLLALEQARLGETNRFKFYQFTAASASGGNSPAPQLSPAMQRAVLISLGRQLGLLPMSTKPNLGNTRSTTTIGGIDFVDLRPPASDNQPASQSAGQPANSTPSQPAVQPPGQLQAESQVTDVAEVAEPAIPAFVSGDKLVLGLDPSVVPANSSVTFSIAGTSFSSGYQLASWSFAMGENPTMVTIPFSTTTLFGSGGATLTIRSVTSSGISNVSQFFAPTSP